MKTISLEIYDQVYPQIVNFLRLLPENCCHLLEDDDAELSPAEMSAIEMIRARLQTGDDSEFIDWENFKDKL
jgi:hypothetical protein